jgi:hypothetical protein
MRNIMIKKKIKLCIEFDNYDNFALNNFLTNK